MKENGRFYFDLSRLASRAFGRVDALQPRQLAEFAVCGVCHAARSSVAFRA